MIPQDSNRIAGAVGIGLVTLKGLLRNIHERIVDTIVMTLVHRSRWDRWTVTDNTIDEQVRQLF